GAYQCSDDDYGKQGNGDCQTGVYILSYQKTKAKHQQSQNSSVEKAEGQFFNQPFKNTSLDQVVCQTLYNDGTGLHSHITGHRGNEGRKEKEYGIMLQSGIKSLHDVHAAEPSKKSEYQPGQSRFGKFQNAVVSFYVVGDTRSQLIVFFGFIFDEIHDIINGNPSHQTTDFIYHG